MAAKKKAGNDKDRPVMDAAGQKPAGFMSDQADLDRKDARAAKLDKGLEDAKVMAAQLTKAIAHGLATDSEDMQEAILDEVATLGNGIRDRVRRALRDAKAPTKNEQK